MSGISVTVKIQELFLDVFRENYRKNVWLLWPAEAAAVNKEMHRAFSCATEQLKTAAKAHIENKK